MKKYMTRIFSVLAIMLTLVLFLVTVNEKSNVKAAVDINTLINNEYQAKVKLVSLMTEMKNFENEHGVNRGHADRRELIVKTRTEDQIASANFAKLTESNSTLQQRRDLYETIRVLRTKLHEYEREQREHEIFLSIQSQLRQAQTAYDNAFNVMMSRARQLNIGGLSAFSWETLNDKWRYCSYLSGSSNGCKTKWQKIADNSGHFRWYFFNNDYSLKTDKDWIKYGNDWMFSTGTTGYLTDEWANIKKDNSTNAKAWFYFDNDGKSVKSGWKKISDRPEHSRWYKFTNYNYDKGLKWVKSGSNWLYIDGNNGYLTNESKVISGKKYNFNNNGYCTNP